MQKKEEIEKPKNKVNNSKKILQKTVSSKKKDVEKNKKENVKSEKNKEKLKVDKKTKSSKKVNSKEKDFEKLSSSNKSTIEKKQTTKVKKTSATKKKIEEPPIDQTKVIEKIKDFITKIVAMQEEANREIAEDQKKGKKTKKINSKSEKIEKEYMVEYYDLPYRYNETIIKILSQTPKKLFVYWDISNNDRNKYIETFGENFFETTYPVLLLYNEDKKYIKEIPINDFANSWYIDIDDSKTKYTIQLGRKFKNEIENINKEKMKKHNIILKTDYLPFADSNMLEAPNDHVLLEDLPEFLTFRNIKTNQEVVKDIRNLKDVFGNNYDVKGFYDNQYKDEISEGMFDMENPSSNLSSSSFK